MFKSFKTNAQLMPAKYVHVGTLINMISNSLMVFFFTKNSVEKLRERRDKLRERLKHGPHEILQEYLKMGRFDILYKLNALFSVLFHLCDCFMIG